MSPTLSFEVFPPKTVKAAFQLAETMEVLGQHRHLFTSVTCGTGGDNFEKTRETVKALQDQGSTDAAAHITAAGHTAHSLRALGHDLAKMGVTRIVAIRGDAGGANCLAMPDVVQILTSAGHDVYVGCYLETHPKAESPEACLAALRAKQDAGAKAAITQFFFEPETFFAFRDRAVQAGITLELIPGLLPVRNWGATRAMAAKMGVMMSPDLAEAFARADREGRAMLFGLAQATELADTLIRGGCDHLHFYTMNKALPVTDICTALGVLPTPRLRQVA